MKTYPGINYAYRPKSYWNDSNPLHAILRNVTGENRRQMILDYAAEDRLEELDANLLNDQLDGKSHRLLGRIHPSFMGGEYLPGYLPGEVEIARICLQSTTCDVISLRARPTATGKIAYRVVDEYQAKFVLPIPESDRPLTLAELVQQFDNGTLADSGFPAGGLSLGYNNLNAEDGDFEGLRHFTSISSNIYTNLEKHYEQLFIDWVAENVASRENDVD